MQFADLDVGVKHDVESNEVVKCSKKNKKKIGWSHYIPTWSSDSNGSDVPIFSDLTDIRILRDVKTREENSTPPLYLAHILLITRSLGKLQLLAITGQVL